MASLKIKYSGKFYNAGIIGMGLPALNSGVNKKDWFRPHIASLLCPLCAAAQGEAASRFAIYEIRLESFAI